MTISRITLRVGAMLLCFAGTHRLAGQAPPSEAPTLDTFLVEVLGANPKLRAATDRANAITTEATASGALPDPRLMLGVANLLVASPGFGEMMTMKQVGISQVVPFPGKRGLERQAADHLATAAGATLVGVRLEILRVATTRWAGLALLDARLEILRRRRDVLLTIRDAAEGAYRSGTVGQDAVWQSRVELSRLALEATALAQERHGAVAALNALRDRPAETPIGTAAIPDAIAHAALDTTVDLQFDGDSLGAALQDRAIPPVATLLEWAESSNPDIAAHVARIAAQGALVDLARKAAQPDLEFSLMYGQRDDRADFVSASVTIPLAVRRGRVQDRRAEAGALELEARHSEHEQMVHDIEARIVTLRADAMAARTALAILVRVILPEDRATLDAGLAGLAAGRTAFGTVLDAEQALYADNVRAAEQVTAYMTAVANLEAVVGREILP